MKELKNNGSGKLPKDIQRRKTEHLTASANDAFATIRITARDATEECYGEVLDYLCAVLEQPDFPRSYSVEFREPDNTYLPIPGLPKKGNNQLFAYAVQYPKLHPSIEQYPRLAMREYEWYNNLSNDPAPRPAPLLYSPWGWRRRSGGHWCATTWSCVMTSTPLCRRNSSTPYLKSTG